MRSEENSNKYSKKDEMCSEDNFKKYVRKDIMSSEKKIKTSTISICTKNTRDKIIKRSQGIRTWKVSRKRG